MKKFVILSIIAFTILSLITVKPILKDISNISDSRDNLFVAWTLAWDNHAESSGNLLNIFNANIYYPNKDTLAYSDNLIGASIFTLPVYIISHNPILIFNLLLIASFILNSLSAELLTYYFTKNKYAAFIGALIWGFCSYKVAGNYHLQNVLVWWTPLCIYFLFKYIDTKRILFLSLSYLMLVMQIYSSLYPGAALAMLYLLVLIYLLISRKSYNLIPKFFLGGIVSVILLLPIVIPYLNFLHISNTTFTITDLETYSGDLGGFFLPSPNTIATNYINLGKTRWLENFNFIGYIALILSLLAVFKLKLKDKTFSIQIDFSKNKFLFILIFIIFFVFSLGPYLWLNDKITNIRLPYYYIYKFFKYLDFIRTTSRYADVAMLGISILAALGYLKIISLIKTEKFKVVITIIFATLIYLEYMPIVWFNPYSSQKISSVYNSNALKDGKPTVILPVTTDITVDTSALLASTVNWNPIVNGYSGYLPPSYGVIADILNSYPSDVSNFLLNNLKVRHIVSTTGELTSSNQLKQIKVDGSNVLYNYNPTSSYKGDIIAFEKDSNFPESYEYTISYKDGSVHPPFFTYASDVFTPNDLNKEAEMEINLTGIAEANNIQVFFIGRAYTSQDYIRIYSGSTLVYQLTNSTDANAIHIFSIPNTYIVDHKLSLKFLLYSTQFTDRAVIQAVGVYIKE